MTRGDKLRRKIADKAMAMSDRELASNFEYINHNCRRIVLGQKCPLSPGDGNGCTGCATEFLGEEVVE